MVWEWNRVDVDEHAMQKENMYACLMESENKWFVTLLTPLKGTYLRFI